MQGDIKLNNELVEIEGDLVKVTSPILEAGTIKSANLETVAIKSNVLEAAIINSSSLQTGTINSNSLQTRTIKSTGGNLTIEGYPDGVRIEGVVTAGHIKGVNVSTELMTTKHMATNDLTTGKIESSGHKLAIGGVHADIGEPHHADKFYGLTIAYRLFDLEPPNKGHADIHCIADTISLVKPQLKERDDSTNIALAHTEKDELILNKDGGYQGGVKIEGNVEIPQKLQVGDATIENEKGNPSITIGKLENVRITPKTILIRQLDRKVALQNSEGARGGFQEILPHPVGTPGQHIGPGEKAIVQGNPSIPTTIDILVEYDLLAIIKGLQERVKILEERLGVVTPP